MESITLTIVNNDILLGILNEDDLIGISDENTQLGNVELSTPIDLCNQIHTILIFCNLWGNINYPFVQ